MSDNYFTENEIRALFGVRPWYYEVGIALGGLAFGFILGPAFMLFMFSHNAVLWRFWWAPWIYRAMLAVGVLGLAISLYLSHRWQQRIAAIRRRGRERAQSGAVA